MATRTRERTALERMLRNDRGIITGMDVTTWKWPSPPTPDQLKEAKSFIADAGKHVLDGFIIVLGGEAELHGQQGGDAWLYGNSQSHGQQGGYARLDGNSKSDGQVGGCYLDQENVVHGDEALMVPLEQEIALLDQIRELVIAQPTRLKMNDWHGPGWSPDADPGCEHTCNTTHCLAGFAQALSPDPAMRSLPAEFAGEKLLPRSARLFFASDDRVMAYLRDREYAQEA